MHMELTLLLLVLLLASAFSFLSAGAAASAVPPPPRRLLFTSMFAFGDSYMDTGNFVVMAAAVSFPVWNDKPPYGMTFFARPTGRASDGRLILDFLAEALGLPFLPASLLTNGSRAAQGVDFAVNGATAIDVGFFERNNLVPFKLLNNSLDVQLGWFEKLIKPSSFSAGTITGTGGIGGCFGAESLFVVGEFGVNDYNFLWTANMTEDQVRSYVPRVVDAIAMAVERLIGLGAAHIVVPGNPPTGCLPAVLTLLRSPGAADDDYDGVGCLRAVNAVAMHHNALLRAAVDRLRAAHPRARIVFADFYTPVYTILQNPARFGVVGDGEALKACCGTGGEYNWNGSAVCGMPGVAACGSPSAYVSWDGVHYTESVNRYVAMGWLYGPYADPPLLTPMPH
ncbi:hypothetical protein U9M48_044498 [Paspalum notatum var. saurae]|uniref:GDSL esterase/lipase n=1 Tax=Paspalum notatum var. saurae TaxID=547442 RepID=A0AAQ3V1D6_PASNO